MSPTTADGTSVRVKIVDENHNIFVDPKIMHIRRDSPCPQPPFLDKKSISKTVGLPAGRALELCLKDYRGRDAVTVTGLSVQAHLRPGLGSVDQP